MYNLFSLDNFARCLDEYKFLDIYTSVNNCFDHEKLNISEFSMV
jgi:hypothetical protein